MLQSGLTSEKAQKILQDKGPNFIPQKKVNIFAKVIRSLISPISLMLLMASVLSFFTNKIFDGFFILVLLFLNIIITLWQENKADDAIQKLNENLVQKVNVLRDGKWKKVNSRLLVLGDTVKISLGEVVPADGVIIETERASLDESTISGESLPVDKQKNDLVFSGSFMVSGFVIVRITATGASTKFGKTLLSIETIRKKSLLEKDIVNISKYLTFVSLLAVLLLSVIFISGKVNITELFTLDLTLIIAGIPVSLPTVMALIIELGVINLAKKKVIVRRLSALEDLANVNYLLTDKTGTLTKNKIVVGDIYSYSKFTHTDVLAYSGVAANLEGDNSVDQAIKEKINALHIKPIKFQKVKFTPADSVRKRSTATVVIEDRKLTISVGAPQIISGFCSMDSDLENKFQDEVKNLANSGFRTLAVAITTEGAEENMDIVGLIALSDEIREEAKRVTQFLKENGISISMVTGDNRAIASTVSHQLGFSDGVVSKEYLDRLNRDNYDRAYFIKNGAFAEILPEDKLNLVQYAKKYFVVAATGDGINDLPALKAANVGIAVKNAVDALKSSADIVLLSEGISVIRDAIIESRKIFERIYSYSLYRISESFRLIITIAVLGILYKIYPLTALQIILIALLNDIPIITLAFDRVKLTNRPAKIKVKQRFILSSLFGSVGVVNSLLLFFLVKDVYHLDWGIIQTMFFLKLTVSGHMLIYVAHTKERWFKYLPSKEVILATTTTQLVATLLALFGLMMPGKITLLQAVFVWIWAFFWMQISELVKFLQMKYIKNQIGI